MARMHEFGVVQAHRTSSNLLEPHLHRDSKVCRVLPHEFGVVRLCRTFSTFIFTGEKKEKEEIDKEIEVMKKEKEEKDKKIEEMEKECSKLKRKLDTGAATKDPKV